MKFLKENNIARANFISSVVVVVLLSMALISTFIAFEYYHLSHELKNIETNYILFQKEKIKAVVDSMVSRFKMRIISSEEKTRTRLKKRGQEAHTAEYIENARNETAHEILKTLKIIQKENRTAEYFFILKIHDINGGKEFATMLVNPNVPELVGTKISDSYVGDRGKQFVKEMLSGIKIHGEAFVQYWFQKPGSNRSSQKVTYWKLFPETNWIIGKGLYLDDLEAILSRKKTAALLEIKKSFILIASFCLIFVAGAIALAYLFSRRINTLFLDYKTRDSRLKKELLQFDLIINQAHDGVIIADPEGKVTYANRSWAKMHGYDTDQMIGQDINLFHSREQMTNEVMPCMQKAREHSFHSCEIWHKHKDGSFFPTTMSVSTISNENNELEGFLGIAINILDIVMAKKKAEEANLAKSTFLANMSHEIRTPMNGIIGMTSLALETQLSREQRKFLNNVQVSANGLLGLLNDILDFSKIEAGQLVIENKTFSLLAMVDNIKSMMTYGANKKGLSLQIYNNLQSDLGFVMGDELRLRQILINLINNSIKFTQKGSIILDIAGTAMPKNKIKLIFSVRDTGIGIPAAKQHTIFDGFSQADASTARQFGGTGLGLSITKQLVELMDGRIRLESQEGKGTTFFFNIILGKAVEERVKQPHTAPAVGMAGLDILLVEDNDINRDLAKTILSKYGCNIFTAHNGLEALKVLARKKVSIILMDIQMPEMDGFTATTIIRNFEKGNDKNNDIPAELKKQLSKRLSGGHLPIVALTANAMSGDKDKCFAMGMDAYLTKPFIPGEVISVISHLDL